jgi:hypothetical protein
MGGTWSGVWLELRLDLFYRVLKKREHHDIANQQQHGMEVMP